MSGTATPATRCLSWRTWGPRAARGSSLPAAPPSAPEQPPAGEADLRAFIGDGPGRIVAALHAAGALPPASPVPGQLAGLCIRTGIPGDGINALPAALP